LGEGTAILFLTINMITMKKLQRLKVVMVTGLFSVLLACHKNVDQQAMQPADNNSSIEAMISEDGANPDELIFAQQSSSLEKNGRDKGHFVYTETNSAGTNSILIFRIKSNGSLESVGSEASGGAGSGTGLGSQGAVALNENNKWLFAVNAGSNSVSSFSVNDDGSLNLAHTEWSGGTKPVSLSVKNGLLYVLNAGSDNIYGFRIGAAGELTAIEGSSQPLSSMMADAPQISFTPNAKWLIVTEKATNKIGSFKLNNDGSANPGIFTASTGQTPFGFEFARRGIMVVSNAVGGVAGAGSATAYEIGANGIPDAINGAVPNMQGAPCWVATTKFGRFAFITNTASNTVSTYFIAPQGALFLVKAVAATTGLAPVDIAVASNNYFVYEINGMSPSIGAYHRTRFGGLEHISDISVPQGIVGLATF
jgi:6-phosphogluconolactonase